MRPQIAQWFDGFAAACVLATIALKVSGGHPEGVYADVACLVLLLRIHLLRRQL